MKYICLQRDTLLWCKITMLLIGILDVVVLFNHNNVHVSHSFDVVIVPFLAKVAASYAWCNVPMLEVVTQQNVCSSQEGREHDVLVLKQRTEH